MHKFDGDYGSDVQQQGEAHHSGGQPPHKEKLRGAKPWGARDANNETDARSQITRLKPGEGARLKPVGLVKASAVVIYSSHLVYGDVSEAPRPPPPPPSHPPITWKPASEE